MSDIQAMERCFRSFIEGSLVKRNVDAVMELFSDDLMGIGMGTQGVVRCMEDVRPILENNKSQGDSAQVRVSYSDLQVRCYDNLFGSVCAAVAITVEEHGEQVSSRIGQCASMRKIGGEWKIYMLQATPLSVNASELDAYPLSFAEEELEAYHMQEQFSEVISENRIAIYRINFTTGVFEKYSSKGEHSVEVQEGDEYERAIFASANIMLNPADRLRFLEAFSIGNIIKSYQEGKREITLDYESLQPDGTALWLRSVLQLYLDKENELKGYLYLIDIDKQKRSELEMLLRAETDSMTGVFNKEATRKQVNRLIEQPGLMQAGALFMLDLDQFKQVNDTFGHSEGDRVIRETAAILKKTVRQVDIIGRLGGDEFCIFYVGIASDELLCEIAEKICQQIRDIPPPESDRMRYTCSIGISRYAGESCFEELYQKADKALYIRKKQQGRNGYTFYQG